MIDEIIYDLLLLPVGDPQDMAVIHVNDMRCIEVAVMQFELIDSKDPRRLLRLDQLLTVECVFLLQPTLRDTMMLRLERNLLQEGGSAFRTSELQLAEPYDGQCSAEAEMPQFNIRMVVHMHLAAAVAACSIHVIIQRAVEAVYCPAGS